MIVPSTRVDDGHAGAGRVTFDDGRVADSDTVHVCDSVIWSGYSFKGNTEVAGAGFGHEDSLRVKKSNVECGKQITKCGRQKADGGVLFAAEIARYEFLRHGHHCA
jgi:hypothetical protein